MPGSDSGQPAAAPPPLRLAPARKRARVTGRVVSSPPQSGLYLCGQVGRGSGSGFCTRTTCLSFRLPGSCSPGRGSSPLHRRSPFVFLSPSSSFVPVYVSRSLLVIPNYVFLLSQADPEFEFVERARNVNKSCVALQHLEKRGSAAYPFPCLRKAAPAVTRFLIWMHICCY
jgi:hypothetical protein